MKKLDIHAWHCVLMEGVKVFHDICTRNGIPYYMLGGTMLGAVRHKGFIPWDDDVDFGVMQEDMPRLMDALRRELPSKYVIRDEHNTDFISGRIVKIENTTTLSIRRTGKGDKDQLGAFIDLFPLLRTNGRTDIFSRNGMASALLKLRYYLFNDYRNACFRKRVISSIVKTTLFWVRRGWFTDLVKRFFERGHGDYVTNLWGSWINKELVPSHVMGTPRLYDFEDMQLYGVADSDAYLTHLYGDYMTLPPENKRHLHASAFFLKDDADGDSSSDAVSNGL